MIDPERLRRGLHLPLERQADGTVVVHGHVVTPDTCDCRDHEVRGSAVVCQHRLRAQFDGLGPDLLGALRQLIPAPAPSGASK